MVSCYVPLRCCVCAAAAPPVLCRAPRRLPGRAGLAEPLGGSPSASAPPAAGMRVSPAWRLRAAAFRKESGSCARSYRAWKRRFYWARELLLRLRALLLRDTCFSAPLFGGPFDAILISAPHHLGDLD